MKGVTVYRPCHMPRKELASTATPDFEVPAAISTHTEETSIIDQKSKGKERGGF